MIIRKKKILLMLLILASSLSRISFAFQQEQCLAVITEIQGDVFISKEGKTGLIKGYWGSQLFQGDQISTLANSRVTLTLRSNTAIRLGSNSIITVSGDAINTENKGNIKELSYGALIDFQTLTPRNGLKPESGALAGVRSFCTDKSLKLSSPLNTLVKTTRPSFNWTAKKSFESYKVYLNDKNGVVWKKTVTGHAMEYPENEKELKYGESYSWYVEGQNLSFYEKSDNYSFTILPLKMIKEISEQENKIFRTFPDKEETGSLHSILGSFYVNQGLLQDAINQFLIVSELYSDSPVPHKILGSLYNEVGEKEKASAEFQKVSMLNEKIERDF